MDSVFQKLESFINNEKSDSSPLYSVFSSLLFGITFGKPAKASATVISLLWVGSGADNFQLENLLAKIKNLLLLCGTPNWVADNIISI